MKLIQIADLFKEIVEKCPELDGKNFVIMKPDLPKPIETQGYEIVIRTEGESLNEKTMEKLKDIATKENLKIEQKPTSIMIFKDSTTQ